MELIIKFEPNQPITVSGPIHDKILAYGMLEAARDAIAEMHMRASEKRIQEASFVPPILSLNRNGGK